MPIRSYRARQFLTAPAYPPPHRPAPHQNKTQPSKDTTTVISDPSYNPSSSTQNPTLYRTPEHPNSFPHQIMQSCKRMQALRPSEYQSILQRSVLSGCRGEKGETRRGFINPRALRARTFMNGPNRLMCSGYRMFLFFRKIKETFQHDVILTAPNKLNVSSITLRRS